MADSPAQADVLNGVRQILKRYDQSLGGVCADFGMTRIETDILAFLYNHPQNDTAADVVRMRMLPKGNVSQGVDALECHMRRACRKTGMGIRFVRGFFSAGACAVFRFHAAHLFQRRAAGRRIRIKTTILK